MKKKIYYGKAVYDNKEINAVLNVLKKNSLSLVDGQNVKKLETEMKEMKHLNSLRIMIIPKMKNINLILYSFQSITHH